MPTSMPRSLHAVTAIAAAVLLLVGPDVGAPAHGAVSSQVLPGGDDGAEVVLRPAALRSDGARAEVEVAVGAAAPGDVLVDLSLAEPAVAADGTVAPGPAADGRITRGGRIRPGEALRATASDIDGPVVVVATVRPVGTDARSPAATTLAAVVLPGPVGPPPEVALEEVDGELRGTITSASPLLVSARLRGARVVTHPDRLVLPGRPVVVVGTPSGWPAPSELVVTDEAGRSTTVSSGRTALTAVAIVLVLVAAAGVGLVVRRRRRSSTASAVA